MLIKKANCRTIQMKFADRATLGILLNALVQTLTVKTDFCWPNKNRFFFYFLHKKEVQWMILLLTFGPHPRSGLDESVSTDFLHIATIVEISFKERSIFQTFWKVHCCAKSLFFQLETSNCGYVLAYFLISFNRAKFQQDWTTLI